MRHVKAPPRELRRSPQRRPHDCRYARAMTAASTRPPAEALAPPPSRRPRLRKDIAATSTGSLRATASKRCSPSRARASSGSTRRRGRATRHARGVRPGERKGHADLRGAELAPALLAIPEALPRLESGVVIGYNHQTMAFVTGPGYFVVKARTARAARERAALRLHGGAARGEPEGWPAVQAERGGAVEARLRQHEGLHAARRDAASSSARRTNTGSTRRRTFR